MEVAQSTPRQRNGILKRSLVVAISSQSRHLTNYLPYYFISGGAFFILSRFFLEAIKSLKPINLPPKQRSVSCFNFSLDCWRKQWKCEWEIKRIFNRHSEPPTLYFEAEVSLQFTNALLEDNAGMLQSACEQKLKSKFHAN